MYRTVICRSADWALELLDVASFLAGIALALILDRVTVSGSFDAALVPFAALDVRLGTGLLLVVLAAVWRQIFDFFGLYPRHPGYFQEPHLHGLVKAVTFGTMVFGLAVSLFDFGPGFHGSSHMIAIMWLCTLLFCLVSRQLVCAVACYAFTRVDVRRRVLIVGTSHRAIMFARDLMQRRGHGAELIGYVDDEWHAGSTPTPGTPGLVCDFTGLQDYLRSHIVDQVCICLPLRSLYDKASDVIELCLEQGIDVSLNTHLFEVTPAQVRGNLLRESQLLTIYSTQVDERQLAMKRAFDVTVSGVLILLLLPLLLLLAVLVRLDSRGPVFFCQDRVGLNKRLFKLIKFRTMVVDAEKLQAELEAQNEAKGAHFKIRDDPRVTRLGRWLRRYSLDELPQFFNVLWGDMSIVGPRPLSLRDFKLIEADWPRRRFSVLPGITCLWQISGRSELNFRHWMALDMEYIDHWSLALDLKIFFKTIPVVLFGKGAY